MSLNNKTTNNVVIVGGLLLDNIVTGVQSISPHCSNPVTRQQKLGGVATNIARVAAQQLNTLLVASIGDDEGGKQLNELLDQIPIPHALVLRNNQLSDQYTAVLNPDGNLFVGLADAQLVEQMQWQDISKRLPEKAPSALVLDANLSESCLSETVDNMAEQYAQHVPIYALSVSPAKAIRWAALADKVDVLICNRREAAALAKLPEQEDSDPLADALLKLGFAEFVITDAEKPVLVQEQQGRSFISVPKVRITQNVNGAGDAMASAIICQHAQGHSLSQALKSHGFKAAKTILEGNLT